VAAAALLADKRLQRLLHLQTRGMLQADGQSRQTGGTGGVAMARAVKTMTTRATKKARVMRARATKARATGQ
jgi:hypothetical protein